MASRLTRWLRDVPVEGRLERESAPAVQVLLLLLAILPMVVWLALRGGVGLASYDLPALSVTSLLALAVVRRGHLRASAAVIAAGFMATLGASLLADGLAARQSLLPLALVPLVIASLLVGRRALWLTLVAVLGIPAAAALRDVPGAWPTAAAALNPLTNTVLGSYALSALFLAAILDRFGTSLRQAYRRSVEQATLLEETNARLQAAESRFQATISGSLDAFLVLDAVRDEHGRVVDFVPIELNERAARLFGMARSALLGARLSAFRPEAFFDGGSFTTWARVVKSRETVELECAPVAPLGGMTWMPFVLLKGWSDYLFLDLLQIGFVGRVDRNPNGVLVSIDHPLCSSR